MIIASEVMPLLLQACPSFEQRWATYMSDPTYDESLLYIHLGEYARHLVGLAKQGSTDEFSAVFQSGVPDR